MKQRRHFEDNIKMYLVMNRLWWIELVLTDLGLVPVAAFCFGSVTTQAVTLEFIRMEVSWNTGRICFAP
jgi:hypothetical protein